MTYCTCYMDYPNECHRHKNGKWKCVDRYKNIQPLETIELGLPFPKYVRKTKCVRIEEGDRMTDRELLECLTDRPCNVCKFRTENGCCKWNCVFEEETQLEQEPINKRLEDIKAETRAIIDEERTGNGNINKGVVIGLQMALDTIDKHISGKE